PQRGVAAGGRRPPPEAIGRYRRAVKIVPAYADAHNNLGLLLAENGKLDDGVVHLREAVALRPDSASYHSNLGLALARQGRANETRPGRGRAAGPHARHPRGP